MLSKLRVRLNFFLELDSTTMEKALKEFKSGLIAIKITLKQIQYLAINQL